MNGRSISGSSTLCICYAWMLSGWNRACCLSSVSGDAGVMEGSSISHAYIQAVARKSQSNKPSIGRSQKSSSSHHANCSSICRLFLRQPKVTCAQTCTTRRTRLRSHRDVMAAATLMNEQETYYEPSFRQSMHGVTIPLHTRASPQTIPLESLQVRYLT